MSDPAAVLARVQAAGLRLRRRGARLTVSPGSRCPPALLAEVRAVKSELLALLAAEESLAPDERPWVAVAVQYLNGVFAGGTSSELEALFIGLRSIRHPVCQEAFARLVKTLGGKGRA